MEEVCDTCSYCVIKQTNILFRGYLWCSHPLIRREVKDPKTEECLFWKKSYNWRGYSDLVWIEDEASTIKVDNDTQTKTIE